MEYPHPKMQKNAENTGEIYGGINSLFAMPFFANDFVFGTPIPSVPGTYATNQQTNGHTHPSQDLFAMDQIDTMAIAEIEQLTSSMPANQPLAFGLETSLTTLAGAGSVPPPMLWQQGYLPAESVPTDWVSPQPVDHELFFSESCMSLGTLRSGNMPPIGCIATPDSCELGISARATTPAFFVPIAPRQVDSPTCLLPAREESQSNANEKARLGKCPLCPKTTMAVRDINRHMRAKHRDCADLFGAKSEHRACPKKGCGKTGRADNIKRHYKSKHGGEFKWRKGVAQIS
jgi:hypothetical protein